MANGRSKKINTTRYWTYIFTPLIILIFVAVFANLFLMADVQAMSYDGFLKFVGRQLEMPSIMDFGISSGPVATAATATTSMASQMAKLTLSK